MSCNCYTKLYCFLYSIRTFPDMFSISNTYKLIFSNGVWECCSTTMGKLLTEVKSKAETLTLVLDLPYFTTSQHRLSKLSPKIGFNNVPKDCLLILRNHLLSPKCWTRRFRWKKLGKCPSWWIAIDHQRKHLAAHQKRDRNAWQKAPVTPVGEG